MATYTWNADGKVATLVDSANNLTLTYDALGRLAEKENGTTYTEYLYGVLGATSNYALELQYLMSRGIGPQQWQMVPLPY